MKEKMKSAFDTLLETMPEDQEFEFKGSVRKAVEALAEKAPKLKDSVLAQSDYSRKMDEVRDQVRRATEWDDWVKNNWVRMEDHPNRGMTKAELEKSQQLEEIQRELEDARKAALATGGDEMTFEQLNQRLEQWSKDKKVLTAEEFKTTFDAKEKEVQQYVRGTSGAMLTGALVASELNLRHFKEFGEPFDSEKFLQSAVDKNRTADLRDYYDKEYVLDKRQLKVSEQHKAEIERINKEKEEAQKALNEVQERLKTNAMGNGGISDSGGPELGPLQRRMLGEQEQNLDKLPEVPLGQSGIARAAAMRDERLAAERRAS